MANRPITPAPPRLKAPSTAAAISRPVITEDSSPSARPERMTVAAPVREVLPTSWTGRCSVPV
ncbi:Uncharacterised protein [Mycobacteroides abscessus subsp. abscessus]|nr:Uncharacterised protein [Mycobacteroides abscessus subsp. abscessus]